MILRLLAGIPFGLPTRQQYLFTRDTPTSSVGSTPPLSHHQAFRSTTAAAAAAAAAAGISGSNNHLAAPQPHHHQLSQVCCYKIGPCLVLGLVPIFWWRIAVKGFFAPSWTSCAENALEKLDSWEHFLFLQAAAATAALHPQHPHPDQLHGAAAAIGSPAVVGTNSRRVSATKSARSFSSTIGGRRSTTTHGGGGQGTYVSENGQKLFV